MPRVSRVISETGYYHVVVRGVVQQTIFIDDEDVLRLLEIAAICRDVSSFALHGYCLMSNHFHLLLEQRLEPLARAMKRIGYGGVWFVFLVGINRCLVGNDCMIPVADLYSKLYD